MTAMTTPAETLTQLDIDAEDSKYLIRSPVEILFILRAVAQRNAMVALHLSSGNDFILTSILDIDSDAGELVLDYGDNQKLSHQALSEDKLVCTTVHDQVKVQFACNGLRKIRYNGKDAFGARLPDALLRVQRRENFRVATPETKPLKCIITLPPGHSPATAEVMLLDISCGGMAVVDHHPKVALDPGTTYPKCRLELPGIGTIAFAMRVQESFPHTLKNGLTCKRAGCEFISMPESMGAMVQRYIIQLERERNARLRA